MGADRARSQSAEQIPCFSGVAPVTERRGKTKLVRRRLACPKFVRQSFHAFATSSINGSRWARVYSDQQRRRGNQRPEAIRSLAYQGARIIDRCWQAHQADEESVYIAKLELRGSPLAKLIPTAGEQAVHGELLEAVARG